MGTWRSVMTTVIAILAFMLMPLATPPDAPAQTAQDVLTGAAVQVVAEEKLDAPVGTYTIVESNFAVREMSYGDIEAYYFTSNPNACRAVMAALMFGVVKNYDSGTWRIGITCGHSMEMDGRVDLNSYPAEFAATQYRNGERYYSTSWTGGY